ncbi:MAG: hypothetical protein HKN27_02120 [Silicimonas sp.]|nr:hypothetical protein [Silicimonas sp.]
MEQPDRQEIAHKFGTLMQGRYGVDFVEDLFSDDDDTAQHAAEEFSDIFFHQEDIYPHTPAAVPHLFGALKLTGPGARAELIYLLAGVATASNVSGGENAMIAEAALRVFERLGELEAYLDDPDARVRLAALMSLTDLARINAPGMRFSHAEPLFVGAYPGDFEPKQYVRHLSRRIGQSRDGFDAEWRVNCDAALAFLTFSPLPESSADPAPHPYWSMLERH